MRALAPYLLQDGLQVGLRRHEKTKRNAQALYECHNIAPDDEMPRLHETVTSMTDDSNAWPGEGIQDDYPQYRTVVIHVHDFVTDAELQTVSVYLDGVYKGVTDVNGELSIDDVVTGGHAVRLTKTNYTDSDEDEIANDFIVVT